MQLTKFLIDRIYSIYPNYDPSVIIDAGSRDLFQSIEFTEVFPNAKIYAFEPNPEQYKVCLDRSKKFKNIEVFSFALSDVEKELDFHVTPSNIGVSSLLEPLDVPWGEFYYYKIKVKSVRLDNIMKFLGISKIDIMWMDVQGGELSALRGCGNYINDIDFIQCEATKLPYYKDHPICNEVESFLSESGYYSEFHLPFEGPPHQYMEGELVCINKKILK
jgi:FkbM family methyltransferase